MVDEILKNEIQIKKFTLQVHENKSNNGLTDNHVMAYFSENGINPTVDFINAWEINAKIFQRQILKYLSRCKDENQKSYVIEKANLAHEMLSNEHRNLAIMSRNVPNNPLMNMTHNFEKTREEPNDVMEKLKEGLKIKKEKKDE